MSHVPEKLIQNAQHILYLYWHQVATKSIEVMLSNADDKVNTSFASFRGIPSRNATSFSTTSGCTPQINTFGTRHPDTQYARLLIMFVLNT